MGPTPSIFFSLSFCPLVFLSKKGDLHYLICIDGLFFQHRHIETVNYPFKHCNIPVLLLYFFLIDGIMSFMNHWFLAC